MINATFTGKIGFEIKGRLWSCVNWPGSKLILGTGKAVKIKGRVDDYPIQIALLPNGQGDHMLSLNKTIIKHLNKHLGDTVTVFIEDTV
jgi:hypothetical protein